MNTPEFLHHPLPVEAHDDKVKQILVGLDKLTAGKQKENEALFHEIYPAIQAAIDRNVSRKSIMDWLASQGLKLHPARFRTLLEAEQALAKPASTATMSDAIGARCDKEHDILGTHY